MRISIIALVLVLVWPTAGSGATRTWKGRKGNEIKADYTGVLNGRVILKTGNQRIPVRLSEFSLADRDFLVDLMLKRRQKELLSQLVLFENNIPVIDPDAAPAKPAEGLESPDTGNPLPTGINPLGGNYPQNIPGQAAAVETEMYGLPLPSPELLVDDPVRTWTSILGVKFPAMFDRVLAPGFLRLKRANGNTLTFAIANFSKEDIDYVKQALQKDMARTVFPAGTGFQSLTPEEVAKGYRVWTDRREVPLVGKFHATKLKNVVIEKDGQHLEYPLAGLSENDQTWIKNELRRRSEEAADRARQAAAERQSRMNSGGGRSPFSRGPFGAGGHGESAGNNYADAGGHGGGSSRFPRSRGSLFPEYKFHCDHCGHDWTGHSPISFCPNCKDTYEFHCHVCGHTWTRQNQLVDTCPKCNARRNDSHGENSSNSNTRYSPPGSHSQSASSSSSTRSSSTRSALPTASSSGKEGHGVVLTIVYVSLGLGLLAGIAVGLFKAFG